MVGPLLSKSFSNVLLHQPALAHAIFRLYLASDRTERNGRHRRRKNVSPRLGNGEYLQNRRAAPRSVQHVDDLGLTRSSGALVLGSNPDSHRPDKR
jgi:hypothetical protein